MGVPAPRGASGGSPAQHPTGTGMQRHFGVQAATLALHKAPPGCRRGDGHRTPCGGTRHPSAQAAATAACDGRIDRRVCGAAPPRGLVRLKQPSISGGGLAAGRAAGGRAHGPGSRGKSDAVQPSAPFSIPSGPGPPPPSPVGVPPAIPGARGAFPGQEGFPDSCRRSGRCWQSRERGVVTRARPNPVPSLLVCDRVGCYSRLGSSAVGGGIAAPSSSHGSGSGPAARRLSIPSPAPFAQPD